MHWAYDYLFYAVWGGFLIYWQIMSLNVKATQRLEPMSSRVLRTVLFLAAIALLVLPHIPPRWLYVSLIPSSIWTFWGGVAITLAGLSFAIWARVHLGSNWSRSVTIKKDHDLITTGPYAVARHPIYTGLLAGFLGTAIAMTEVRGSDRVRADFCRPLDKTGTGGEVDARAVWGKNTVRIPIVLQRLCRSSCNRAGSIYKLQDSTTVYATGTGYASRADQRTGSVNAWIPFPPLRVPRNPRQRRRKFRAAATRARPHLHQTFDEHRPPDGASGDFYHLAEPVVPGIGRSRHLVAFGGCTSTVTTHHFIWAEPNSFHGGRTVVGKSRMAGRAALLVRYKALHYRGIYLVEWLVLSGNLVFMYWRGYKRSGHAGGGMVGGRFGVHAGLSECRAANDCDGLSSDGRGAGNCGSVRTRKHARALASTAVVLRMG